MRKRTIALLLMAATALATVAVLGVAAAQTNAGCTTARVLSGSNFEIDTGTGGANLKVNDADCIDWLNPPDPQNPTVAPGFRSGVEAKNDTASGALDESFGQGTAEDNPNPTVVNGSIPPKKSDLKAFGVFEENDEFLELFWSRVQDPGGTTTMDFELNQNFCDPANPTAATCANNGPNNNPTAIRITPNRLTGDKLITYDLSKGGTVPTISIRTWNDTTGAWGSPTVISGGQDPDALGSVNTTLIPATETGGATGGLTTALGSQDPFTFGEAAVSFDALFGPNACGEFGSAYLKSRSSDSFTSEIKDFVPPEQVDIGNCPTTLTTDATDTATLPTGTISDQATLDVPDGTDGTITFRLYGPFTTAPTAQTAATDCVAANLVTAYGTNGATTKTVTNHNVTGGTTNPYTSTAFTPTAAGIYQWTAEFTPDSGQGLDPSGEIGCGQAVEQSVVNKAAPTLTTDATDSVTLPNVTISDSATLSGATSNAGGTITFKAYGPFDPSTPASSDTCVDSGTGANLVYTSTARPIGSPNATTGNYVVSSDDPSITTDDFKPTAAGRYQWVATYSGDSNNTGVSTNCNDPNEQSLVNKAAPTLTTDATDSATLPNGTLSDTATLSGATSNAGGTITFKAYGPFSTSADPTTDACTAANLVYTSTARPIGSPNATTGNYVVSSDDPSITTDDFKPTAAGRYQWVATYSGDNNNTGVSTNCNDPNEQSLVNKAPSTISTAQKWVPNDTATLDHGGGTVTFTLLKNVSQANCLTGNFTAASVIYGPATVNVTETSQGSGVFTASTSNTTAVTSVTSGDTYLWRAKYSGTATHEAVLSCEEATTFTSLSNGSPVTNPPPSS